MSYEWTRADIQDEARPLVWRPATLLILALWTVHFSYVTLYRMIAFPDERLDFTAGRALVTLIGIGLSLVIVQIHTRAVHLPLARRLLIVTATALIGCALHATVNCGIFHLLWPEEPLFWSVFAASMFEWLWFYSSLSAIVLVLTYSEALRDRERRMAELSAQAHAAQVRALRYQLNPHFLFNTLNSVAALVGRSQNSTAEAMIENLSDFLRTGLELDPHDDIPLARELELQALYLDIERTRFPDRLEVELSVPDRLLGALVPSLIIQPLVENAIKYAVARSSIPVRLTISAREAASMLHIRVADDGGDAPAPTGAGTRVGLANVEARLKARFDGRCRFVAGPRAGRGFKVELAFPLTFAS